MDINFYILLNHSQHVKIIMMTSYNNFLLVSVLKISNLSTSKKVRLVIS